ncbi:MAG: 2-iminobutanoate/2-iminopropanoate deaminase [Paraburkholderia sp.]|jgi:reactive intermediate/imine deaminase|nr:2-iminobutanoate/2-iminopropanoate deaminase [Paraburkholderia sp.]
MPAQKAHFLVPNASPPPTSSLYSHAVQAAGWLYVTGQLPTDPDAPSAELPAGIEAQAELCFKNLTRILEHTGYTYDDTVFARIYLSEFERDFALFNAVYARYFQQDGPNLPSRTTIGVAKLGRNALVEIDLVCYLSGAVIG